MANIPVVNGMTVAEMVAIINTIGIQGDQSELSIVELISTMSTKLNAQQVQALIDASGGGGTGSETKESILLKLGISDISGVNSGDQDLTAIISALGTKASATDLSNLQSAYNSYVTSNNNAVAAKVAQTVFDTFVSSYNTAIAGKVDKVSGSSLVPDTSITKLNGIATGATANATDAQLRSRPTHTGTQAINTITDLPSVLDSKADLVKGKIPLIQLPEATLSPVQFETLQDGTIGIKTSYLQSLGLGGTTPKLMSPTLTNGAITGTSIVLNWTASDNANNYILEENVSGSWVSRYNGANLTYTHTGLTAGTTHTYRVTANRADGTYTNSDPSSPLVVNTSSAGGTGILSGYSKMNAANGLVQYTQPVFDVPQPNETTITATNGNNINMVPKYNILPNGMFGFKILNAATSDFGLSFVDAYDNKDGYGFGIYQGSLYDLRTDADATGTVATGDYMFAQLIGTQAGGYTIKAFKTTDGVTLTELVFPSPITFANFAGITNPFVRFSLNGDSGDQTIAFAQYKGGQVNTTV